MAKLQWNLHRFLSKTIRDIRVTNHYFKYLKKHETNYSGE